MTETIAENKKHRNQVKRIWKVFWLLAIVTTIEVVLGIYHPDILENNYLWNMEILNWIFIILTIVKAYYITWTFMHMEQETANLRRAVVWTIVFYLAYMVFIFLAEGHYLYEAMNNSFYAWDF